MRRDPRTALLGAAICFAGFAATGVLALLVPLARTRDSATLQGFQELNRGPVTTLADHVAHLCDPIPYAVFSALVVGLALLRGRARVALAVAVVLVAAPLSAETLKPLLATSRGEEWLGQGQIRAAAWPSGHATAALTLALCAVLAAPGRWRPLVGALGGVLAVGVSYAVLVLAWHFPSDVLGGFFVSGLYVSLAVAALLAAGEGAPGPVPSGRRPRLGPVLVGPIVAAVGALCTALVVVGPDRIATFATDHPTFMAGAGAIAALAIGSGAALAGVLAPRRG